LRGFRLSFPCASKITSRPFEPTLEELLYHNEMVTGIETAGLALAAFPLLIQGLGLYLEGARKIRDMRGYEMQLKQWVGKIEMEQYKFENNGERLLEYTSAEWVGSCWKCPEIEIALRERLRGKDIPVFKATIETLKLSLHQLCDDLGFTENCQVGDHCQRILLIF